jgi:uracil-DNA glycosylase family 4
MKEQTLEDAKENGDVAELWWELSDCLADVSAWVRGQQYTGAWGFPASDPAILAGVEQRLRDDLSGAPPRVRQGPSLPASVPGRVPAAPAAARPTPAPTTVVASPPMRAQVVPGASVAKPTGQPPTGQPIVVSQNPVVQAPVPEPPPPISRVSDRAALPPPAPLPPLPKPDFQRDKSPVSGPGASSTKEAPAKQLGLGAWGNFLKPDAPVESPDLTGCIDLAGVRQVLGDCRRCALHRTRKDLVFGQGPEACRLLIIGEQPEMEAEREGKPLGGPGGQMVERILSNVLHIGLDSVYWTTAVKCRPPSERKAFPEETQACAGFLRAQARVLGAPFMLVFGPRAHAALFPGADFAETNCTIRELRLDGYRGSALILPALHDLLENQGQKKVAFAALKELAKAMAS